MSSSGSPCRPIGCDLANSRYASSLRATDSCPRLDAASGAIALATMPSRPHSRAAVRVRARIASFDALYGPYPAMPVMPAAEAKFTMRPQPCAFMCGYTACIAHKVPLTVPWFVSMSSALASAIGTCAVNVCALLMRPSMRPYVSTVVAMAASIDACSRMLHSTPSASTPRPRSSSTTRSTRCAFHSATTTVAPCLPRCRAMPRPMPCPDPVIRTTLPSTSPTGQIMTRASGFHLYRSADIYSWRMPTRTQEERKADTRARLIAAAADLFARKGFHAVSAEAVADAADRTTGALYSHFGNKEGLLFALLEVWMERTITDLRPALEDVADLDDRLGALWGGLVQDHEANGHGWVLLEFELWLHSVRGPALALQA